MQEKDSIGDVAIIGIGCRFPGGANSPQQFWKLLSEGRDAISHIPNDRFDVDAVFDPDPEAPGKIYSTWGGFIENVDEFDADFFGISPREARRMDPQHRLLLEVTWEALEDAGQVPEKMASSSTGVYIGISSHDYADMHVQPSRRKLLDAHINIGNALSVAANRISYLLDLHGPSFAIESACSSSLTALHLACQSLHKEESSLAIVGGVNLILAPELTVGFCKAGMISPDGRCRAFDSRANGYVRSEGAGVVILKSLKKAKQEGDPIYAIVRGTAINEDGRTAGISLPNGSAQEKVLRQALENSGCDPQDIHYVEAHGTGTAAGDPIEAGAMGRVYGASRSKNDPCIIGSVKTNLGHLEAGAGMAGLIKTALALKHRKIPPNLHFDTPNPEIPFEDYHLKVPTTMMPWPESTIPARAGVNAFGFGGTNAHVILEESPAANSSPNPSQSQSNLLAISARTTDALADYVERYKYYLKAEFSGSLKDLCDAAANRKSQYKHRLAVVGSSLEEMVEGLEAFQSNEGSANTIVGKSQQASSLKVAFAFSGMGPQWFGMGRQLFSSEPTYRDAIVQCDKLLKPISGWSIIDELNKNETDSRIAQAELAHVANFVVQVALVELWKSWGIEADVVVGHSSGEIAAACTAGALSLNDALHVAYHRGRLQHTMAGTGGMLAAALPVDKAEELIKGQEEKVSLAAVNSKDSVTFSGDIAFLKQLRDKLEQEGRFCRLLQVDVPYHGPQMQQIRDELLNLLSDLKPRATKLPIVSSVRGSYIEGEAFNGEYWWQNVRHPVRFDQAIGLLLEEEVDVFLEIGPHPVLSTYLLESLEEHEKPAFILSSLRRKENEREMLFRSLGKLFVQGYPVNWRGVYPEYVFVSLPSYPWQRERHWMESLPQTATGTDTGHPLLGKRIHTAQPIWETSLDDPRSDFLNAHLVENSIIFPGAGYVEMMLSAAGEMWKESPLLLKNIQFHKLLFLEDSRKHVLQCCLNQEHGSLEIFGTGENNGKWAQHAGASVRMSKDGLQPEKLDLDAIRQRCNMKVPVEEHFRVLESRGFNYGSAFRGIEKILVGEGEALAHIVLPKGLNSDAYRVHPALLDAAFQVLVVVASDKLKEESSSDPLFPVSIGQVNYHASASGDFLAYIRVREGSDTLLEGDVLLVNDAAEVVISVENLRAKLLQETKKENKQKEWSYEFRWEEQFPGLTTTSNENQSVRKTSEIQKLVETNSQAPEDDLDVRLYHDVVVPELNRIASNYALHALKKLGWSSQLHKDNKIEELCDHLRVKKAYKPLFAELLRMGNSQLEEGNYEWNGLKGIEELKIRAPQYAVECELVKKGGEQLAEILTGDTDVREVLLSSASMALLSNMYHNSPACHNYQHILAEVVANSFFNLEGKQPPRILEIGAGTGAATLEILPRLPKNTQYVFTDISPYFLTEARERFGKNTEYSVLDIEKDPVSQGFREKSFDMVVAANVLHTTQDLKSSLAHVRQLLKPGGLLVILEITRKADWFNLVFGLLDGWWRFADSNLRKDSPLIGWQQWQGLLAECNFCDARSLYASEEGKESLQTITFAHSKEEAEINNGSQNNNIGAAEIQQDKSNQGSWLILADKKGIAKKVAKSLNGIGDRCILAHCGEKYVKHDLNHYQLSVDQPTEMARLFSESGLIDENCKGVIHLWPLDALSNENINSRQLMESQQSICVPILQLLQQQPENFIPTLWLVTSGAQVFENGMNAESLQLAQSPLWGLGRVVANEFEAISCKLVDLSSLPSQPEINGLIDLILGDCEDEEIAIRGDKRFVRRLHRLLLEDLDPKHTVRNMSPETDSFRLEVNRPGALESLGLKEIKFHQPGKSELVIRVQASGLNFQEVLSVLDLFPREALPKALDRAALGLECAGIVLECGEGITDFKPGDEVIALASSAHGSRAIAQSHLVVHKPEKLSFVQAASLINAFVTSTYSLQQVARITEDDSVLIHSATGGVGLAAIQVCREIGAEIFATAGTQEKRDYLRSLGIKYVMDSRSTSFVDEVLTYTEGKGVDVVLNSLKGKTMEASLNLLRPYGRFIELGKRDIYENSALGLLPFQRNLSYTAVDLQQMALDRPSFANRMISQVVQDVANGRWEVIPTTTFDLSEAEHAFRYMAQAKHIGKIVLTVENASYPVQQIEKPSVWKQEASYLITGGLGGFGLATAKWLTGKGVDSLVLMSRSGKPKDDGEILEQLKQSSTKITIIRGDVSKEEDVRRVLDFIREKLPPLKGIIHAAMTLEDYAISNLNFNRLHKVMLPKVAGTWNLHCLTKDDELDHFILFSSVASALGHPMQGNYSAANTFMDTLAGFRKQMGLPALSIGWGAVSGAGYVSRHPEVINYLNRSGLEGFPPEDALTTMEKFLETKKEHVLIAKIDWAQWIGTHPVMESSRRFSHVFGEIQTKTKLPDTETESPLETLLSASPEQLKEVMDNYLARKLARISGGKSNNIDLDRPLTEMGFDSLMTVELTTALHTDLGIKLPVVKILQGINSHELGETLIRQLPNGLSKAKKNIKKQVREQKVSTPFPLSAEQNRFWYLEQLSPGDPALHLVVAAHLGGPLDKACLQKSIQEVVRRHEVLRSSFNAENGNPEQRIEAPMQVPLSFHDFRDLPASERETEWHKMATSEIQKPFSLQKSPLLRALLVQIDEQAHNLLLTVHHIAADSWTMALIAKEVMTLYTAFSKGEDSPLSDSPYQYTDYVSRQQKVLTPDLLTRQLEYWKGQLGDMSGSRLNIPTDFPQKPRNGIRGAHIPFELSKELSDNLRNLSRKEGVTLFVTLLASFQTLLLRYSNEEDISTGTPVSTKSRAGTKELLGCCMNTVVLRNNLSGNPKFRELLQRTKNVCLQAFENQDIPFQNVVEALRPTRTRGQSPLYTNMLILHNIDYPKLDMRELSVNPLSVETGAAVSDLTLLMDNGDQLRGSFEYNRDLFEEASAQQILDQLVHLLGAIVTNPDLPVQAIPLMEIKKLEHLHAHWNATTTKFPKDKCLHHLFEEQVAKSPESIALVFGKHHLTYGELDFRANALVDRLQKAGLKPNVIAGIFLEKSPQLVVALLGIIKAGGAFLLLDSNLPKQRLKFMVEDANLPLIITDERMKERLPQTNAKILEIGEKENESKFDTKKRRSSGVKAGDLAYVVYTSGTTGHPKGVLISHRAICNQIHWRQSTFPLTRKDSVLQRTPLSFDPTVWEFFGTLSAGARLVLPDPGTSSDAFALATDLTQLKITCLQLTPGMLDALLEEPAFENCRHLSRVFCGGEPMPPQLPERFKEKSNALLINLYGPAEATIDSTYWDCSTKNLRKRVPIGNPIANAQVYILGQDGQPLPSGVPGELCIGGFGLADGYLNRHQLTSEKFIPHPFENGTERRLYRSGDLVRRFPDGTLDLLGRMDEQVKVRGFRVEPKEVEATLQQHPEVQDAVIVGEKMAVGGYRLLAYVVPEADKVLGIDALQHYLNERLPAYMVPSAFQFLDALPQLPNGKVDRHALRKVITSTSENGSGHKPPRNKEEKRLIKILEDLLEQRPIGITDDFFEIGGHSLLAMRFISAINREFDEQLQVSDLLTSSNVKKLACLLNN